MPPYPKYTTTVIGAHSVPRWYETLDRLVTLGQLQPADLADAQFRAMQAAILEQEVAGIDVITGGEMHRRTHNRQRLGGGRSDAVGCCRFRQGPQGSRGEFRLCFLRRHQRRCAA